MQDGNYRMDTSQTRPRRRLKFDSSRVVGNSIEFLSNGSLVPWRDYHDSWLAHDWIFLVALPDDSHGNEKLTPDAQWPILRFVVSVMLVPLLLHLSLCLLTMGVSSLVSPGILATWTWDDANSGLSFAMYSSTACGET